MACLFPGDIDNPHWHSSSFPTSSDGKTVLIALPYEKPSEEKLQKIKDDLKLVYLDSGYSCGRYILKIHEDDISRVYQIIEEFVRVTGIRVYMNDGTELTFDGGEFNQTIHESLVLKKFKKYVDAKVSEFALKKWTDKNYWKSDEGQKYVESMKFLKI